MPRPLFFRNNLQLLDYPINTFMFVWNHKWNIKQNNSVLSILNKQQNNNNKLFFPHYVINDVINVFFTHKNFHKKDIPAPGIELGTSHHRFQDNVFSQLKRRNNFFFLDYLFINEKKGGVFRAHINLLWEGWCPREQGGRKAEGRGWQQGYSRETQHRSQASLLLARGWFLPLLRMGRTRWSCNPKDPDPRCWTECLMMHR